LRARLFAERPIEHRCLAPRNVARRQTCLYGDDDLMRLQQILIGRELGLALEDIRRSQSSTKHKRRTAKWT
jgi:DNA-binding transcriptional MerR regulator